MLILFVSAPFRGCSGVCIFLFGTVTAAIAAPATAATPKSIIVLFFAGPVVPTVFNSWAPDTLDVSEVELVPELPLLEVEEDEEVEEEEVEEDEEEEEEEDEEEEEEDEALDASLPSPFEAASLPFSLEDEEALSPPLPLLVDDDVEPVLVVESVVCGFFGGG